MNHLAATFLRVRQALEKQGLPQKMVNQDAFIKGLINQLLECKSLMPQWKDHVAILKKYAKNRSPEIYKEVCQIIKRKKENKIPAETLREMHRRTLRIGSENIEALVNQVSNHENDLECATCFLAKKQELFVEPSWSYLYLFGEAMNCYDPYAMSQRVDHYYDLMLDCKAKQERTKQAALV